LGGAYGIKAGVEILPAMRGDGMEMKALQSARDPNTGEDSSL